MIYRGSFTSIDGRNYDVAITTKKESDTEGVLTFGGTPFVVTYDNDDTIFKPLRLSSANLGLIIGEDMFDLFHADAKGVKIELSSSGLTQWIGYTTPNIYSSPNDLPREELEVECLDGLSILEYILYKREKPERVISLKEIFGKIMYESGCYDTIFINPSITVLDDAGREHIVDWGSLYIYEESFFDEKKDNETDDDVAWNCKDVIEEVCKWLGLTLFAQGRNLYVYDYSRFESINDIDVEKPFFVEYKFIETSPELDYRFELIVMGSHSMDDFFKTIRYDDYAENGRQLNLLEVYSQFKIKDKFYNYDDILPDILNGELENKTSYLDHCHGVLKVFTLNNYIETGYTSVVVERPIDITNITLMRYKKSPKLKTYHYRYLGNGVIEEIDEPNVGNILDVRRNCPNWNGIMEAKTYTGDEIRDIQACDVGDNLVDAVLNKQLPIKFDKYLCSLLNTGDSVHTFLLPNVTTLDGMRAFTISSGKLMTFQKDSFLKIDYKLMLGGLANTYMGGEDPPYGKWDQVIGYNLLYPNEGQWTKDSGGGGTITYNPRPTIDFEIKVGSKWLDENGFARDSRYIVKIDVLKDFYELGTNTIKGEKYPNGFFDPPTNQDWRRVNDKGYFIKLQQNIYGEVEISLLYNSRRFSHYFKDFNIEHIMTMPERDDSDTIYSLTNDTNSISEMEDIEFKVCTYDDKKASYNTIMWTDDVYPNNMSFVDKVKMSYNNGDTYSYKRQEEHMCERLWKQYSSPTKEIEINLKNNFNMRNVFFLREFPQTRFIPDKMEIDYRMNSNKITLVEIK